MNHVIAPILGILTSTTMLTDISQIPNLKWPSYPNGLLSIQPTTASAAMNHTGLSRANAPVLPPTPREQGFHPFPAQHQPLAPTLTINFSFGHERQPRRTNGGGTPDRWTRSKIAANNSRGHCHLGHRERHVL